MGIHYISLISNFIGIKINSLAQKCKMKKKLPIRKYVTYQSWLAPSITTISPLPGLLTELKLCPDFTSSARPPTPALDILVSDGHLIQSLLATVSSWTDTMISSVEVLHGVQLKCVSLCTLLLRLQIKTKPCVTMNKPPKFHEARDCFVAFFFFNHIYND